jgi:hypothetical protein
MRTIILQSLTLYFIVFSNLVIHADGVFKWKDAQGNTQYGDEPPANVKLNKFKMPEIMVVDGFKEQWKPLEDDAPKPDITKNPLVQQPIAKQSKPVLYTKLAFIAPRNKQVMGTSFNGAVSTMLTIKPPLKRGHHIILTLDGKDVPKSTSRTNNFSNLSRGIHTVLAKIIDRKGETINQSETISFRIMRNAPRPR